MTVAAALMQLSMTMTMMMLMELRFKSAFWSTFAGVSIVLVITPPPLAEPPQTPTSETPLYSLDSCRYWSPLIMSCNAAINPTTILLPSIVIKQGLHPFCRLALM